MSLQAAWSDAEGATVRRLASAGHSASAIGAEIGKTKNAVISYCNRRRIALPAAPTVILRKPKPKPALRQEARRVAASAPAVETGPLRPLRPVPVPVPVPVPFYAVTGCRWILDAHPSHAALTCNAAIAPGGSYCAAHRRLAFRAP
jgi:hypothetical protein